MNESPFEVNVSWVGVRPQSSAFYAVPKGERRQAELTIHPKLGIPLSVTLVPDNVPWLELLEEIPKSGTPPFQTTVVVDTSTLDEGLWYDGHISVLADEQTLARKLVRVHVRRPPPPPPPPVEKPPTIWERVIERVKGSLE